MATTEMSSEQLVELIDVLRGSDTVELKVTVDDSDMRSAGQSLGFDALEAQIR